MDTPSDSQQPYETAVADGDEAPVCGRCRLPFDPADTAWDGGARYRDSPWCRRCVDRCHESTDFAHACPICDPARR